MRPSHSICLAFILLSAFAVRAADRLIDNGDGTITDSQTKLIWLKNANAFGDLKWDDAISKCSQLASGQAGLNDASKAGSWRLPTKDELVALANLYLSLKDKSPFTGLKSNNLYFWSATVFEDNKKYAYGIYLFDAEASDFSKASAYAVWPVRTGK